MIELLIQNGAIIEAKSLKGNTALHLGKQIDLFLYQYLFNLFKFCKASQNSSFDAVELLLKHGANVNSTNAEGETPFHIGKIFEEFSIFLIYLYSVKRLKKKTLM